MVNWLYNCFIYWPKESFIKFIASKRVIEESSRNRVLTQSFFFQNVLSKILGCTSTRPDPDPVLVGSGSSTRKAHGELAKQLQGRKKKNNRIIGGSNYVTFIDIFVHDLTRGVSDRGRGPGGGVFYYLGIHHYGFQFQCIQ